MTTNARTCPTCGTRLPLGVLGCAACEKRSGNAGLALSVAAGAAVAGALVWGGLTWMTGYEVGYVAWGIGLLVGASAVWAGGRGRIVAAACALLALVSIAGGRVTCIELARRTAADEIRKALTPEEHAAQAEMRRAVAELGTLAELGESASDDEIRNFLIEKHGVDPDEIDEAVIQAMRAQAVPLRKMMHAAPVAETFSQWRDQMVEAALAELNPFILLRETLSAVDFLFALLGITTAFGLVMNRTRRERMAAAADAAHHA